MVRPDGDRIEGTWRSRCRLAACFLETTDEHHRRSRVSTGTKARTDPVALTRGVAPSLDGHNARTAALMLMPLLIAGIVLMQLWLAGRRNVKVVSSNLESPRLSSGHQVVDLVQVPEQRARLFNVTLFSGPETTGLAGHVRIQLAAEGQTRILIVRQGHRDGSRWAAIVDWLRGRARLIVVADRGWLDLGRLPRGTHARELQIVGLLGGSYSFFRPKQPSADQPLVFELEGWGADGALPAIRGARFEIVAPDPLGAAEVLTRVLFFVRQSQVLIAAAALAAIALVIGWFELERSRHSRAAFLLLASAVMVHAVLLPPLQGADETSHVATVEGIAAKGVKYRSWWYPESIAVLATALDQDRVQQQPSEPLPVRDADERAALAAVLTSPLEKEFQRPGEPPAGAFGLSGESRAPAFYELFRVLGPIAPHLSIADRVALYRLTAVTMALALLGAGLVLLVACGLGEKLGTAYCALFTFPYAVMVMASCSNYAPAIGCGGLVGAAAVAAILAPSPRARRASRLVLVASAWLGAALWRDFALGAVPLMALAALGLAPFAEASDGAGCVPRRALPLVVAAAGTLLGGAVLWTALGGYGPEIAARITALRGSMDSWIYALAVAPLAATAALAGLDRRHRARSPERRRRDAVASSVVLAGLVVALWLVTPPTRMPYETTFLRGWEFLSTATATVLSTNLSWDQDRLTWKFVLGTGGWHDVFLPDAVYAIARWLAVPVLLSLPVLSLRCRLHRPRIAAALLLLAGIGLTLMATTLSIRHAALLHPHGRFVLPWLGLALLPVIARSRWGRDGVARLILRGAVLFHVWASLVVVGLRYALGS